MNDLPLDIPPLAVAATQAARAAGFTMSCEARTGALLRTLAASKPGGHILEIGTGVGVGAAWLLAGMDASAHLVTIDIDRDYASAAWRLLHRDRRCHVLSGDGAGYLAACTGPFDLVFVDASPGKFERRDLVIEHLAPGGLYVGDDLRHQPHWPDTHARRVERFLADIRHEPQLVVTLMDWASGLVVATRRTDPNGTTISEELELEPSCRRTRDPLGEPRGGRRPSPPSPPRSQRAGLVALDGDESPLTIHVATGPRAPDVL